MTRCTKIASSSTNHNWYWYICQLQLG